ncbi:MAG: CotH kinase family protein [Clostridia bacterium]|nr:CotH kinase family protein [Clostridia bacterium]
MNKARLWLAALCMVFAVLFCGAARCEGAVVTLKLGQDTLTDGNREYVKDARKYERDLTVPMVGGMQAIKVSQTGSAVTWLCPVSAGAQEITVDFPYGAAWTTVSVNGQLLSHDSPVQVTLGQDITVQLASKNKRCVLHLSLSLLPVVTVHYTGSDLYANQVPGTMTVYDPDYAAHGGSGPETTLDITIGYRGQSSLNYDKHNFTVHLWKDGEKYKTSLLGMRRDDDWILCGAMNDQIRLRNTVAMQLWDEYYTMPWSDRSGAIGGAFCEVYMQSRYIGLYRLTERLDRKQADIDKDNGQIVRSVQAEAGGVNLMDFTVLGKKLPGNSELWYNMELKYPKPEDMQAQDWDMFYGFLKFVVSSDDQEFAERIGQYIDIDNFAAYYVYITATGATGNMIKNLYFVMPDKVSDPLWRLIPWDMDGSFGRRNDATRREVDIISSNHLFERLVRTNAGGFCDLCREKWQQYRDTVFSYDHMMSLFREYYDALALSGVWERETAAWPRFKSFTFKPASEMEYMEDYMKQRWDFTDAFFTGESLSAGKWLK